MFHRSHVLLLSILPLIPNILITPVVVISAVSLPEFLKVQPITSKLMVWFYSLSITFFSQDSRFSSSK